MRLLPRMPVHQEPYHPKIMKTITIQSWRVVINSLRPQKWAPKERAQYAAVARKVLKRLHPFESYLMKEHYVNKVPFDALLGGWVSADEVMNMVDIVQEEFAEIAYSIQFGMGWTPASSVRKAKPKSKTPLRDGLLDSNEVLTIDLSMRIFNLTRGYSNDALVAAYRRLIKNHHPDKVHAHGPHAEQLATSRSQRINAAYQILQCPTTAAR
jgi:hypothetical protein